MTTAVGVLRAALALTFVVSGVAKLLDRAGTREAVAGFGVPVALRPAVTWLLPLAELAAAGLFLGSAGDVRAGAVLSLAMLAAFTVGIVGVLRRGEHVECRCFGALSDKPLGWSSVLRNTALGLAAAVVLARADHSTDAVTWARDRTVVELAVGTALVLLTAAVAVLARLLLMLVRKHGEVLVRLERLEAQVVEPLLPLAPAPDFRLTALHGGELTLGDLGANAPRDHVLLVFMDEHCAPCTALLPSLADWQQAIGHVLPLAVVASGSESGLRAKFGEQTYPVLVDTGRGVQDAYGVSGTPAAVVVSGLWRVSPEAAGADQITQLVRRAVAAVEAGATRGGHAHDHAHAEPEPVLAVGEPIPPAQLLEADGRPVPLGGLIGVEPRVLLFWDVTCGFCERLAPELQAWEAEHGVGPVVVITRNVPGVEVGLASPTYYDPASAVGASVGAPGTPSAVLVDADGRLASPVAAGGPAVMSLISQSSRPAVEIG